MGFDNSGIGWLRWLSVRAPMAPIMILTRHRWWVSLEVWWVSFACLIRFFFFFFFFFFFLGLKLLDCVMFLFGVKMKENKRRLWVLLLF